MKILNYGDSKAISVHRVPFHNKTFLIFGLMFVSGLLGMIGALKGNLENKDAAGYTALHTAGIHQKQASQNYH